jgi:hypothetical protein
MIFRRHGEAVIVALKNLLTRRADANKVLYSAKLRMFSSSSGVWRTLSRAVSGRSRILLEGGGSAESTPVHVMPLPLCLLQPLLR